MSRLSDESTATGITPASGVLVKGNEWPHESDSYSCFLLYGTGVCQFVWKCYHQFFETIYEPWIIQIANVLFGKDSYFHKYILGWYFWIWKIETKSFICIKKIIKWEKCIWFGFILFFMIFPNCFFSSQKEYLLICRTTFLLEHVIWYITGLKLKVC